MTAQRLTRAIEFERLAAEIAVDAPIPCTIATQTPVQRHGVAEVLDCTASGVDLSRSPLPLIVSHDSQQLSIGLVENIMAMGERVVGEVRFASSPAAQQVRADVLGGIHRSLSVGYMHLDEGTPITGGVRYRWQPYEVSIVSVPADPAAGFFRSLPGDPNMNAPTIKTSDAAEIIKLCRTHRVEDMAEGLIERGMSVALARAAVLEELARRDLASGGHLNIRRIDAGASDERERIVNTLVYRMGGKPSGDIIGSTDCAGLALRALQLAGQRVADSDSRDRIIQRALMTTGDFPSLLGSAIGHVLHDAYSQAPAALKTIARLANLPDFRDRSVVRLGGAPTLEKVNEHGEFRYGAVNEASNAWRLITYGRIVALSRQALVNDDLSGFADLLNKFGHAAARREADELTAALVTPPQVEGADLFSTNRSSLITTVLKADAIGAAILALRNQKDLDSGFVSQEPATLVVPAALEMTARQLTANITPNAVANVQPFTFNVVVEPRLDAASATAWYLVAGNQSAFEYGYLDGAQGVQTTQREGFEIDGLEIKARLDFGCGWVSPVGWVKSTGTVA